MHAFRSLPRKIKPIPTPIPHCLYRRFTAAGDAFAPAAAAFSEQIEIENEDLFAEEENASSFQRGSSEAAFGRNRIGCIVLPPDLELGIKKILNEQNKPLIREDALRMYESFRSTSKLPDKPDEPATPSKRLAKVQQPRPQPQDSADPPSSHVINYGLRESVAYIAGAMPSTFAAICNVLLEVRRRVPGFVPGSVLDFGAGPGTAIWASREVYHDSLRSYSGVDISEQMLRIAEELLTNQTAENKISDVEFKRYFSYNPNKPKTDLVISAFTLNDIPTDALRSNILESLWRQTGDVLVLIERGTPFGYQTVMWARDWVLNRENRETVDGMEVQGAHVVAPCPHDGPCPMLGVSKREWCHFSQKVQRPEFLMKTKHAKINFEDARYSYVVLQRGARPAAGVVQATETPDPTAMVHAAYRWPRLILPPLKRNGHIIMDVCTSLGHIERMVIPKSQGKVPYYDARKVMWGDLFPHAPKNPGVRRRKEKGIESGAEQAPVVVVEKRKRVRERKRRQEDGNGNDDLDDNVEKGSGELVYNQV